MTVLLKSKADGRTGFAFIEAAFFNMDFVGGYPASETPSQRAVADSAFEVEKNSSSLVSRNLQSTSFNWTG